MFSFLLLREGRPASKRRMLPMQIAGLNLAKKLLRAQVVVAVAMTLLALVLGPQQAMAVAMGCAAALIPYALFVYLAFAFSGARMAQATVRAFYLGEAIKIISSVVILVITLLLFRPYAEWVLVAFAVTMVPVWLGPLFLKTR